MTPQQKKIELEWAKCRKEMRKKFLAKPNGKDLMRVIVLTLLVSSLVFNVAQAEAIHLMGDKLDEINEIAAMQNGWVWFDLNGELPATSPWETQQ